MKRARSKKHSFFSKKDKKSHDTPQKEIYSVSEPESDISDAADNFNNDTDDFAVPSELLDEAINDTAGAEPPETDIAEDFEVFESDGEDFGEKPIPEPDTEDFAVFEPEDDLSADDNDEIIERVIVDEQVPDPYENTPEDNIPFSTEDYTETNDNTENSDKSVTPTEDLFMKKREQKRIKWEKKRRKRRIITVCVSAAVVLLSAFFIVMGIDFSGTAQEDFLTPVDTASGKINVLILGVDKDGERSDSIMLVNYDFDTHQINLMSIPRDTKMYVTDRSVNRKITEVHGMHDKSGNMYGAAMVAESVTALTGVPINYYIEFSFDTIDRVMDILGPVTFDVPDIEGNGKGMNYDDDYQDLHIHLKPGVQELSGNQIQQFMRYRKSNKGTTDGSDISRISRQQELLQAIIDQKINISLILKIPDIFKELKTQLKTNFTTKDVLKYAGYLNDISSDNMVSHVLPGESKLVSGAWYYIPDFDQTVEIVTTAFGYDVSADDLTNEISLTGKKTSGKTNTSSDKSSKNETNSDDSKKTTTDTNKSTTKTTDKQDTTKNTATDTPSVPSQGTNSGSSGTSSSGGGASGSTSSDDERESEASDNENGSDDDDIISLD